MKHFVFGALAFSLLLNGVGMLFHSYKIKCYEERLLKQENFLIDEQVKKRLLHFYYRSQDPLKESASEPKDLLKEEDWAPNTATEIFL